MAILVESQSKYLFINEARKIGIIERFKNTEDQWVWKVPSDLTLYQYNLMSAILNISDHIRLRNDKFEFIRTVTTDDFKTVILEVEDKVIFNDDGVIIDVLDRGKYSIRKVEDFN